MSEQEKYPYPLPHFDDEYIPDADGIAIDAAIDLIEVILQTDPGVYDEIAAPVLLMLRDRMNSYSKGAV